MSISLEQQLKGLVPKVNRKQRKKIAKQLRSQGIAASYARYSSIMQDDSSNDDQHRSDREEAAKNGDIIPPEFHYSDEAISGTKRDRAGLNRLIEDAKAGKFATIYFYSLSRLARESLIGMKILKELVRVYKIRVISVSEGIDTERSGWEMHANLLFMFHEKFIEQLAADVLKAQAGVVLGGNSVGDHRFGYTSTPIPGAPPRGKSKKVPKQYGINQEEAQWVEKIFKWFVEDRLSITKIVKLLNENHVHKGHRGQTSSWSHSNVISILESTKYVGLWPWGLLKNQRDPNSGRVWQDARDADQINEKWSRYRPDLQIIEVDLFKAAQARLQQNREANAKYRKEDGTFNADRGSRGNPPRHFASNLFYCQCGHKLYVGGSGGKYLFCPNYKRGVCDCKTTIRKDLATKMVVELVVKTISADEEWLNHVYKQVLKFWNRSIKTLPGEIQSLQKAIALVETKIEHLLDRIESGSGDLNVDRRLDKRKKERQELVSKIDDLVRSQVQKADPPTMEWIKEKLSELQEILQVMSPAAIEAFHQLLGSRIEVEEVRSEEARRYIRGKVVMRISDATKLLLGNSQATSGGDSSDDFVTKVNFKDNSYQVAFNTQSEKAKSLYDQGLMNTEIGSTLGVSRSMVTKLLRHWFETRGQTMPDGRQRRSTLTRKHLKPPYYQEISGRVKELMDQGLLLVEISEMLDTDRNTITSAARHWYESRGLEYQDGRARRKVLDR